MGNATPTPTPAPTTDELLAAALDYARQGIRVHPLKPGTKKPILKGWPLLATTKRKTIRAWWLKYPHANIGVATGKKSDLWILDLDEGGQKTIDDLGAVFGPLDLTRVVSTPSGGTHHWFAWPDTFDADASIWRNSAGALGRGVDVRAEGGLAVAAPSMISKDKKGNPYPGGPRPYVTDGVPIVPVPSWLADLTKKAPHAEAELVPQASKALADLGATALEQLARWESATLSAIAGELEALKTTPGRGWDNEVVIRAFRLVEIARASWSSLTLDDARDFLLRHSPQDDGFNAERVLAKWSSALIGAKNVLPMPFEPIPKVFTMEIDARDARALRKDPDAYFDKSTGILAERLADDLAYNLATGIDGLVWVYEGGVWLPRDDEIERRAVRALGDRYRSSQLGTIRSLILKGRELPTVASNPTPSYINLPAGMLNWVTGELVGHDPAFLSTVQLPIAYDAAAECPTFDAWLAEVVPADAVPLLWEALGYLLMSGNPLQKSVLLHGEGGTGKGTFLRLVEHLLGAANISGVTLREIVDGKFEVAGMFGKIANIAGDIDAHHIVDTSKFKQITGEDKINAQHKFAKPFRFTAWAVPIFSANELWASSDVTSGYFRRWLPIPFPNKVMGTHGSKFDEGALSSEAPGILNKATASLRVLMARGHFEITGSAGDLMHEFEQVSDVVRTWLSEDEHVLAYEAGNTAMAAKRTDVYRVYAAWCDHNNYAPLNSRNFAKRLTGAGYALAKRRGTFHFLGVSLDVISPLDSWMHAAAGLPGESVD